MKIKVLFITPDFYPHTTGFSNACVNLVNVVKIYGWTKYKVYVYSEVPLEGKDELPGLEVFRRPPISYNKLNRMKMEKHRFNLIKNYIDDNNIDIIFIETNTFPFLQLWLLKEYGNKVFVRIHSTADTEMMVFYEHPTIGSKITYKKVKEFMYGVSNIITTSEYYLDFIKKYYYNNNVYRIWENKVYSKIYNTAGENVSQAKPTTDNAFVTMGKMSENGVVQKGITDLIKGIYLLKERNDLPEDFSLKIIGDGSCKELIYKEIEIYGLHDKVEIIPVATHQKVYEYMSCAKAVILLSRYEGQSMFVTEALSLGKPLLLTDNNGMSDMIIDGYNGYLVKTGDTEDIYTKLKLLINANWEELSSFGDNSRKIYDLKYTPNKIYEQFDNAIMMRVQ